MKKRGLMVMILTIVFLMPLVSAELCSLDATILTQDPYPAIPGEYVDVVFQITGIENTDCGQVTFELKEKYPITLDPGIVNPVIIQSGVYERNFNSFLTVPYNVRIDDDALDGDNPIEVVITSSNVGQQLKEFNLNIEDSRVDFEIFVKDYDFVTNIMTFEILNIGESDIEALTVQIPHQDSIDIKGPNRNVIGDLDSNEYTTAEFEATSDGGDIEVEIIYTDSINVRRSTKKIVSYDPEYFEGRKADSNGVGIGTYIFWIAVIGGIGYWLYRRAKKKKHKAHSHR